MKSMNLDLTHLGAYAQLLTMPARQFPRLRIWLPSSINRVFSVRLVTFRKLMDENGLNII